MSHFPCSSLVGLLPVVVSPRWLPTIRVSQRKRLFSLAKQGSQPHSSNHSLNVFSTQFEEFWVNSGMFGLLATVCPIVSEMVVSTVVVDYFSKFLVSSLMCCPKAIPAPKWQVHKCLSNSLFVSIIQNFEDSELFHFWTQVTSEWCVLPFLPAHGKHSAVVGCPKTIHASWSFLVWIDHKVICWGPVQYQFSSKSESGIEEYCNPKSKRHRCRSSNVVCLNVKWLTNLTIVTTWKMRARIFDAHELRSLRRKVQRTSCLQIPPEQLENQTNSYTCEIMRGTWLLQLLTTGCN